MKTKKQHPDKPVYFESEEGVEHAQLVLAGQPNCGKSTLFNEVAGYRAITANFPGATVTYTRSHVRFLGMTFDVVDLPGIYSLTSLDEAARETQHYLLSQPVDVIINVVDASLLGRSLELTLQLMELEIPMILCLNMSDEAERKGIYIDEQRLSCRLGIPVVKSVASKGRGVREAFISAYQTAQARKIGRHIRGNRDVEHAIAQLTRELKTKCDSPSPFPEHLLATKILEGDPYFMEKLKCAHPDVSILASRLKKLLSKSHGRPSDEVISSERHAMAMALFEQVSVVSQPRRHWKERLDDVVMHPVWGYVILAAVLFLLFNGIFRFGRMVEAPLLHLMDRLQGAIGGHSGQTVLWKAVLMGAIQGVGGGISIVLPYLVPFLLGLSLLEDIGYLPRVAFLMDGFMHRIGLHGKAVIPAILGYGCNVPAVMSTRILESRRDRFIAALISSMVPCAARMAIIMGLTGYTLGGTAAMMIYAVNLVVVAVLGKIMSRLMPEVTPGMIMEMPAYQAPRLKILFIKLWLRLKEFIFIAWPLLVAGNVLLVLADHFGWTDAINAALSPVTWILGLPPQVGTTLIFGILKKELSMLMLFQALGTSDVTRVLNPGQILVFTLFVVFYIPCVATIGVLYRQVKIKGTAAIILITLIVALLMGFLARCIAAVIW